MRRRKKLTFEQLSPLIIEEEEDISKQEDEQTPSHPQGVHIGQGWWYLGWWRKKNIEALRKSIKAFGGGSTYLDITHTPPDLEVGLSIVSFFDSVGGLELQTSLMSSAYSAEIQGGQTEALEYAKKGTITDRLEYLEERNSQLETDMADLRERFDSLSENQQTRALQPPGEVKEGSEMKKLRFSDELISSTLEKVDRRGLESDEVEEKEILAVLSNQMGELDDSIGNLGNQLSDKIDDSTEQITQKIETTTSELKTELGGKLDETNQKLDHIIEGVDHLIKAVDVFISGIKWFKFAITTIALSAFGSAIVYILFKVLDKPG